MSKISVDIDYIKNGLESIGYIISDCIERENNGKNWQIKFNNSDAIITIYDSNKRNNTVVNGRPEPTEKEILKEISDGLKSKEFKIDPLNEKIIKLIHEKREMDYYDFKLIPHKDKESLLHDILCLSNNVENKDAYLIIGVDDSAYSVEGIKDEDFKSNDLYDFLKTLKFAGNHMPKIEIKNLRYKYKKIVVIICKSSKYVPFYLTERYKSIHDHQIYTRVGDTNTPRNQHANYADVEKLWKFHFDRQRE